jgi:hypothetical protein
MDLAALASVIHESALAEWLRNTLRVVPIVESIHMLALAVLFGSLLIVDLRLIGLPSSRRAFSRVSAELLPLTWWAFGLSALTGALLFTVNAVTYYGNTAFRFKMALLLLAGLNMLVFHRFTLRSLAAWDNALPPPSARAAGAVSLILWISIIVVGRWIGFTKGYDFTIPEGVEFDFTFAR